MMASEKCASVFATTRILSLLTSMLPSDFESCCKYMIGYIQVLDDLILHGARTNAPALIEAFAFHNHQDRCVCIVSRMSFSAASQQIHAQ